MINIEGLRNAKEEDFFNKDGSVKEGMPYYVHSYHSDELETRKIWDTFKTEKIQPWLKDSRVYVEKSKRGVINKPDIPDDF